MCRFLSTSWGFWLLSAIARGLKPSFGVFAGHLAPELPLFARCWHTTWLRVASKVVSKVGS